MNQDREHEFRRYAAARREALLRTAYLMCGDWHRAEDAVQTALIRLYGAWPRVRTATADAYARQVVTRVIIDEGRRGWFRRERAVPEPPDVRTVDPYAGGGDRNVLVALAKLPARQRATLVLRFWEDLSVEQTAEAMRCTTGTVKSQTARGLQTLRGELIGISTLTEQEKEFDHG